MESHSLCHLGLLEARSKLLKKEISSVELTQAFLAAMAAARDKNVFITETADLALEQARRSDEAIAHGAAGALEGLPLAINDLYCTQGVRTTAASRLLENFIPPYESTVTQNLRDAGAVFLGKTNMDEFAMGSANLTSYFGPVISPVRSQSEPEKDLVPGGSSGGSAAAVAGHLALAATASDTGGSIRQPASFTGTVGIKPTYGLCSRYGMVALASSLDQAGPITKSVRDAALMLSVMASYDPQDSTSLNIPYPQYLDALHPSVKGMKLGLPKECFENLAPDIARVMEQSVELFKRLGADVIECSLPNLRYALPAYYVIMPAEASSNLARYDGVRYGFRSPADNTLKGMYGETRREGFGREARRRIFIGTYVLSKGGYESYYVRAQKVRRRIEQDFTTAFEEIDLILMPTTTGGAFGVEEGPKMGAVEMYLNDIFTVSVNMAWLPGISIPAGVSSDGLPLGIQLVGPRLSEQTLFNAAAAFEDARK